MTMSTSSFTVRNEQHRLLVSPRYRSRSRTKRMVLAGVTLAVLMVVFTHMVLNNRSKKTAFGGTQQNHIPYALAHNAVQNLHTQQHQQQQQQQQEDLEEGQNTQEQQRQTYQDIQQSLREEIEQLGLQRQHNPQQEQQQDTHDEHPELQEDQQQQQQQAAQEEHQQHAHQQPNLSQQSQQQPNPTTQQSADTQQPATTPVGLQNVLVHVDLKGAPPRVSYLEWLFATVASLGATGVLIEWEDKFPYKDALAPVVARNAYTEQQVQRILHAAKRHGLSVMPLVQTFGHLEFVLKTPAFSGLREDPTTPQALCPSRNASARLVENLIDQIMAMHPTATHLHIGSDEVFVLGRCERCRLRRHDALIAEHIARTARYARQRHRVRVVMWEDMLRNINAHLLRAHDLSHLVEPMMWWYTPNVRRYVAPSVWQHAEAMYTWVWGAGAFKGAFGSQLLAAPADRHVENNLDWRELLLEVDARMRRRRQSSQSDTDGSGGVRGLVLTGWQRYDHFATLCEVLPGAIPSLTFSLAAVRRGTLDEHAVAEALRALSCRQYSWFGRGSGGAAHWQDDMPFQYRHMEACSFPGQRFYLFLRRYNNTLHEVNSALENLNSKQMSAWLGSYNRRHNFTSVLNVQEQQHQLYATRQRLEALVRPAFDALSEVFDQDTTLEWIEHRIHEPLTVVSKWEQRLERLRELHDFQVRPLRNYPPQMIALMNQQVPYWNSTTTRRQQESNMLQ